VDPVNLDPKRDIQILRWVAVELAKAGDPKARLLGDAVEDLAAIFRIRDQLTAPTSCITCGRPLPAYAGRGRRRLHCEACRAPRPNQHLIRPTERLEA
jgi:hypothetical protein